MTISESGCTGSALAAEPQPQIGPKPTGSCPARVASAQGALVDEETSVEELLGGEAQVPPEEEPEVPAAAVRAERPALVAVPSEEPPSKPLLPRMDAMYDLLKSESPEAVVSDAEQFVVSWVTALVLADGNAGLDPATVTAVEEAGFIPLSTWKGHPSLGSRLRNEFRNELGRADASSGSCSRRSVRREGDCDQHRSLGRPATSRYTLKTKTGAHGVASRSRLGTISALVAAERFERERMGTFVDSVVIRVERLARRRRRKVVGDETAVAQLDETGDPSSGPRHRLAPGRKSSRVGSGTRLDEGEQPTGWQPRWDQGIKSNLAPLQRLGIISFPVLTERELSALEPAG